MTHTPPGGGPLVEPGEELTREELQRYARHLTLDDIGMSGQRRLKNARVLVVGAGGLGSPVLQYLAAAGVGTLGVVDDDDVDVSNLQRQVIHGVEDLGVPKVDSAADAVARINPLVTVHRHRVRLDAAGAVELIRAGAGGSAGYDLVIDGADNFATRYVVSDACTLAGVPCVWGSILRFDGRVSVFWSGPEHDGITYRDLHPDIPPPGSVPSCAAGGVVGALPGTVGSLMATEAIKVITGTGEPLYGRLLIHDGLAMTFRELRLTADPEAPAVRGVAAPDSRPEPGGGYPTVTPRELPALLDTGAVLVDVREDWERRLVSIPGAVAVPLDEIETRGASALPAEVGGRDVVFHCKSGARSERALDALGGPGGADGRRAVHLAGGILAWLAEFAPEEPGY